MSAHWRLAARSAPDAQFCVHQRWLHRRPVASQAARRAFFLTPSITERDTANRHLIPAVDSVWRACPGDRRARWLPMLLTTNPAASG